MPTGEIDTREACRRVLADGKNLYVPRVGLDFERPSMEMTRVVPAEDWAEGGGMPYDDWPRNRWGIPEAPHPTAETPASDPMTRVARPGEIDLLVVPGLAFDRFGSRLGQGKGYYDRFIGDTTDTPVGGGGVDGGLMGGRWPLLVAVGLEPSFVDGERIPMADYDVRMDRLIVPYRETMVFRHS